ncbi:anaerobic ribonucleoside-triphosphate reductase activating protein [Clostridiales Family XIII bacterium PM5-7]
MMAKIEGSLRIAGVVKESIVDGPGLRFVIFSQGCPHHCEQCHNAGTHDFDGGYECELEKILTAIDENPLLAGVTFSGGEPVCQAESFLTLAKAIKSRGLDIIMYSGYTYEELCVLAEKQPPLKELINTIDTLIDGKYDHQLRDLTLSFRGSKNQRVIDMKRSQSSGQVVLREID